MNSNSKTSSELLDISTFLRYLEQRIKETIPGKYFSVSFNGKNTIVCSISSKVIRIIDNIDLEYASYVEDFLKNQNIPIKKFRSNPYAFEATFKKSKPSMM